MEWSVEVRGMEGSGTVGIMKARQAGRGSDRIGTTWRGTSTQARCVKVARGTAMQGELRQAGSASERIVVEG